MWGSQEKEDGKKGGRKGSEKTYNTMKTIKIV